MYTFFIGVGTLVLTAYIIKRFKISGAWWRNQPDLLKGIIWVGYIIVFCAIINWAGTLGCQCDRYDIDALARNFGISDKEAKKICCGLGK